MISQPTISASLFTSDFSEEKEKKRIELFLQLKKLKKKRKKLKCKTLLKNMYKITIITFKQSVEFLNIVLV